MLLADIPGYREAIEAARKKEDENRELAFLGVLPEIGGAEVNLLTPRLFLYLIVADNAFVSGREPGREDVAMLLWVLSPKFRPGSRWRRYWFVRSIRDLDFQRCVADAYDYIDRTFMDSPAGRGGSGESYTCFISTLVTRFASQFGWSDEKIMDTPLMRLNQYLRDIQLFEDPKTPLFNRYQDRVKRNVLLDIKEGRIKA